MSFHHPPNHRIVPAGPRYKGMNNWECFDALPQPIRMHLNDGPQPVSARRCLMLYDRIVFLSPGADAVQIVLRHIEWIWTRRNFNKTPWAPFARTYSTAVSPRRRPEQFKEPNGQKGAL